MNHSFRGSRLPPQFRRLAWSNLVAQSAEQIGLAVTPLVAVFALGATAGQTGFLQTAQTLPFLLLSIPFGVWADRYSRKRVMVAAEAVRLATLLTALALLSLNALSLPWLAILGFVGASGTVAYSVAAPAVVPKLVDRELLPKANSMIELARSAAYSAGPAVGGLLVGWIGPDWAYGVAVALSAWAVALLSGLSKEEPSSTAGRHFVADLVEGARFVCRDTYLRPMIGTAMFFNIGLFTLQAVYVPYAVHHLQLGAAQVGLTFAAYGIGMMCGAYFAAAITKRLKFGLVLVVGPICGLLASIVMVVSIYVPSFWPAALGFFLLGVGPMLWVVGSTTLRQAITPSRMLGRVSAINSTASFGARPLGALVGAVVAARWGVEASIWAAVGGFAIQAAVLLTSSVPRLETIPEMPSLDGQVPQPNRV